MKFPKITAMDVMPVVIILAIFAVAIAIASFCYMIDKNETEERKQRIAEEVAIVQSLAPELFDQVGMEVLPNPSAFVPYDHCVRFIVRDIASGKLLNACLRFIGDEEHVFIYKLEAI